MVSTATRELITIASLLWKLDPDVLLAVIDVESGGKTRIKINGKSEPVIRFDRHLFHHRLSGVKLEIAIRERLASPEPGGGASPVTQAARWRMLNRAAQIDKKAAYEATFWGMGQVPGAHWSWLGFSSIYALVKEARSGADGQLNLMMSYIEKASLLEPLRQLDWATFAKSYRSPDKGTDKYRQELTLAYRRRTKSQVSRKAKVSEPKPIPDIAGDTGVMTEDDANSHGFEGVASIAQRVLRMIAVRRE